MGAQAQAFARGERNLATASVRLDEFVQRVVSA